MIRSLLSRFLDAAIWHEFGVMGWLVALVAGVSLWGLAATSVRPDWTPIWIGWPVSFLGMLLTGAGLSGVVASIRYRAMDIVAEARFEAPPRADLAIFLEREEFHPFQWKANLLEAKIRVVNRTDKTKHILGTTWEFDPSEDGPNAGYIQFDVHRALFALKERRSPELHGTISPRDTISGWVFVSLPHQPWGESAATP